MQVLDNFFRVLKRHVLIIIRIIVIKINFRCSLIIFVILFILRILVKVFSICVI